MAREMLTRRERERSDRCLTGRGMGEPPVPGQPYPHHTFCFYVATINFAIICDNAV